MTNMNYKLQNNVGEKETMYPRIEGLSFQKLGTEIDLQIIIENEEQSFSAQADLLEIKKYYNEIEEGFSRFNEKSELSFFNKKIGEFAVASNEMLEIAKKAILYNKITDGFFDPRIVENLENIGYDKTFDDMKLSENLSNPKPFLLEKNLTDELLIENDKICFKRRMDFSGIVKGYATDKMSKILSEKGWKSFLVDSGGDIFFSGNGIDGKKWRVDIEGIPERSLLLELTDIGIATSGIGKRKWERNGKRFHHIINPKNPDNFLFGLQSVTVIDKTTEQADIWAKTLFLMGKKEGKIFSEEKNKACVILEYSGSVWISSAAKKYIFSK